MQKLHEQAYDLAKEGHTNIEIFGVIGLSPAHLIRVAVSDTPLLFAIIRGRVEFMKPYITALADEALTPVSKEAMARNFRALQAVVDRYDAENRALGVGYDMGLLSVAAAPTERQLRGAELTKALRETS